MLTPIGDNVKSHGSNYSEPKMLEILFLKDIKLNALMYQLQMYNDFVKALNIYR